MKHLQGQDSEAVGHAHSNSLFDTRECNVEFADDLIEKNAANVIAENMHAQTDDEGNQHLIVDKIANHQADVTAAPMSEGCATRHNGGWHPKVTTQGWSLSVQ